MAARSQPSGAPKSAATTAQPSAAREPSLRIEVGVPLPEILVQCRGRNNGGGGFHSGGPGPRRAATVAIRSLARSVVGASVLIPFGTYAHEPQSIRVAALRAGGRGWFAVRKVRGGHRIWKAAHAVARAA